MATEAKKLTFAEISALKQGGRPNHKAGRLTLAGHFLSFGSYWHSQSGNG